MDYKPMEWISNLITEIYQYLNYRDDTGIDRLNRLYTVAILSAFVTLISSEHYVIGKRIVCWTQSDFSRSQITYAHNICWLGHTNYYVSENLSTLDSPSSPRTYPFLIYPWLPLILIGMAISFAAPYLLIWNGLSTRSGIDIKRIMKLTKAEELSRSIHFILIKKYSLNSKGRYYLISIYLLTKTCYIINSFIQIILINKLITGDYGHFNIVEIFKILSVKYNMWSSAHLPIETMCDFMIRMLGGNNNWYTLQCILPYNLFTKRIFALLTIWFIILLILNLIDLIFTWLWQRLWVKSHRYNYIMRLFDIYGTYLRKETYDPMMNNKTIREKFVYKYLGVDGYLLIKFLHANLSEIQMGYLVFYLFDQYLEDTEQKSERIKIRQVNTNLKI